MSNEMTAMTGERTGFDRRQEDEAAHWELVQAEDEMWAHRERMGDDEAWECGEMAAMREEARREAEADYRCEMAAAEEEEREDAIRYPGGRCDSDSNPRSIYGWKCDVYDPIPF